MELTEEQLRQIQETHDTVLKIDTVLLGGNGSPGFIQQTTDEIKCIKNDHAKLKQAFWILIVILAGSGITVGSLLDIFK